MTFIAKVGQDTLGDQAIAGYQREGIVTDHILRDPTQATGVALILVDDRGENLISVASGANHALRPADIEQAADAIRAADIVVLQLEIPLETVIRTAEIAAAAGVPVVLDPAPPRPARCPPNCCENVTYLKPNETEAERLTGVQVVDQASAQQAAEKLLAAGAKHVIITMGAAGRWWSNSPGKAR